MWVGRMGMNVNESEQGKWFGQHLGLQNVFEQKTDKADGFWRKLC